MTSDRLTHLDRFYPLQSTAAAGSRPSLQFRSLGGTEVDTEFGPTLRMDRIYDWDTLPGATSMADIRRVHWQPGLIDTRIRSSFGLDQVACVDIETTGLSLGAGTVAFLVGVISAEERGLHLRQYLIRDFSEESAQQWLLSEDLRRHPLLITYNGRTFDLPILRARAVINRIDAPWLEHAHLDLLPPVRSVWRDAWPDCRLATAEMRLLGVVRHADCEGWEVPLRYRQFLQHADEEILLDVIEHNAQDLVSLLCLTAVLQRLFSDDRGTFGLAQAELLGLARTHMRRGRNDLGVRILQEARTMGRLAPGYGRAMRELVRYFKRERRVAEARHIWQELTSSPEPLERYWAHIEEAKYQEHGTGDLDSARAAADAARLALDGTTEGAPDRVLAALEHRAARLIRREKRR